MNISFEYNHPHIFHEILDLSVHFLPAYRNTASDMLSISDANTCVCGWILLSFNGSPSLTRTTIERQQDPYLCDFSNLLLNKPFFLPLVISDVSLLVHLNIQ